MVNDIESALGEAMRAAVEGTRPRHSVLDVVRRRHRRWKFRMAAGSAAAVAVAVTTALTFGNDKPFRCQSVEDLAQRTDADAVVFLHRVELEASRRRQHAENDVGANALIAAVADRHRWLRMLQDRQF